MATASPAKRGKFISQNPQRVTRLCKIKWRTLYQIYLCFHNQTAERMVFYFTSDGMFLMLLEVDFVSNISLYISRINLKFPRKSEPTQRHHTTHQFLSIFDILSSTNFYIVQNFHIFHILLSTSSRCFHNVYIFHNCRIFYIFQIFYILPDLPHPSTSSPSFTSSISAAFQLVWLIARICMLYLSIY